MARDINIVAKWGLVAFAGYTAYGLALNGSLGPQAHTFALQLRSAWGGTPARLLNSSGDTRDAAATPISPSAPATPVSTGGWVATNLRDLGGVPVQYNTATGQLRQDPSWVAVYAPSYSPNYYSSGVFQNADGEWFQYQGSGRFVAQATGATLAATSFTGRA
jgi:hypothetical protein